MRPSLDEIFQWDVSSWSRAMPHWQQAIDRLSPSKALALGEREGGLSLWLATHGIQVICSDLRPFPPATRELHDRYVPQGAVQYEQQDATLIQHPSDSFDVVIFKSMIGALGTKEKQRLAMNEMHRVLRPGGILLFAENLKASWIHAKLRKSFVQWNSYWRYLDLKKDKDLFASFGKQQLHTTGLLAVFGRTETQKKYLATLDRFLCPIVPASSHYIVHGVLTK